MLVTYIKKILIKCIFIIWMTNTFWHLKEKKSYLCISVPQLQAFSSFCLDCHYYCNLPNNLIAIFMKVPVHPNSIIISTAVMDTMHKHELIHKYSNVEVVLYIKCNENVINQKEYNTEYIFLLMFMLHWNKYKALVTWSIRRLWAFWSMCSTKKS